MNEGLVAAITSIEHLDNEDASVKVKEDDKKYYIPLGDLILVC